MPHITTCHRCPHRQRPCNGPCPCTIDGEDIVKHAATGYCPAGRFAWAGVGDALACLFARVGIVRALAWARQQWGWDCGCKGRQEALNRWRWSVWARLPVA
jgi:hypothetical protein